MSTFYILRELQKQRKNYKNRERLRGFFLRFYLFILERERRGNRGRETSCVIASHGPPTGDLAHNPGTDCESERRLFGSQAGAESSEPHQPGPRVVNRIRMYTYRSLIDKRNSILENYSIGFSTVLFLLNMELYKYGQLNFQL